MKYNLLILILMSCMQLNASYCYSGIGESNLYVEDGKLYRGVTSKDHNGVSYISKGKTMLVDNINLSGFKVLSERSEVLTFSTDSAYYLLRTGCCLGNKEQKLFKLYDKKEISDVVEGLFFKVKGEWQYVRPVPFKDEVEKMVMSVLPKSFEVVRWYNYWGDHLLLRDKQNLYIVNLGYGNILKTFVSENGFEIIADNQKGGAIIKAGEKVFTYNRDNEDREKGKLHIFPDLTASQTKISFIDGYTESYIYDDDTFYEMNSSFFYSNLTPEFNFIGMKDGFSHISEFTRKTLQDISFFDADSTLWVRANISLHDGPTATFYPLVGARYVDEDKEYILYKGNVYDSAWGAAYQRNKVNTEDIKSLSQYKYIHLGSVYSTDGEYVYYKTDKIDWLTPHAKRVFGIGYIHYYLDGNKLIEADNNNPLSPISVEIINSPPVDLTLAYATDNIILVEGRSIKNIADKNSMSFLGSTVRVVRMCDSFGTPPVKIDFFYFFRDKAKVYYYYTGLDEMKILEGLNPNDYKPDNFDHLKILESFTNQQPIETEKYNYD